MRILVTGAAGFIGSHLAERLATLGHEVLGLDCFTDNYARTLKELNVSDLQTKGIDVLELDLADDSLAFAVNDVEIVYHCAAQPGICAATPFEAYVKNNIVATHRLLEAARNSAALKLFVNVATSSIYGAHATSSEQVPPAPISYYGVTKLAAEQLVLSYQRQYGMPCCSLRLFSVYGPRERPEKLYPQLIKALLSDTEFPLFQGSEDHSRSFTYIGDIVDGLVSVVDNMDKCVGEILNIGSDVETRTADAINTVAELVGRKPRLARVPQRPGDQLKTHANIAKAQQLLGYQPKVTLRQGLQAEVDWYQQRIFQKVEH